MHGGYIPLLARSNEFDRREGIDHNSKQKAYELQNVSRRGRLAQLGERRVRNAEAGGSIPPPSTNLVKLILCFSLPSRRL